jgi:P27 family predicted phage terminase small subunit
MTRRKPTALRLIEGNRGKRALPTHEAKVPPSMPQPPEWLNEIARAEWDRVIGTLYTAGLMSELDRAALCAYCTAWARYVKAELALAAMADEDTTNSGLTITTANNNVIQHPMLGIARRAKADMLRAAKEFGLTPASRAGVEARPPVGDDAANEFFT